VSTPHKILHDEKKEAARLGLSVRTLQAWRVRGDGPPFIKINGPKGAVRYDPAITDRWLDSQVRTNTGPVAA
jgi:hypothetical protein